MPFRHSRTASITPASVSIETRVWATSGKVTAAIHRTLFRTIGEIIICVYHISWRLVREVRRVAFRQSAGAAAAAGLDRCGAMQLKIMAGPAALHSTWVRAADNVLDPSAKAVEIEDIEARVAEQERATQASKQEQ